MLSLSKHGHQHVSASSCQKCYHDDGGQSHWSGRDEELCVQWQGLRLAIHKPRRSHTLTHSVMGNSSHILWDSPPFVSTAPPGHETQPVAFCSCTICLCFICIGRVSPLQCHHRNTLLLWISVLYDRVLNPYAQIQLLEACPMLPTV